METIIKGGLLDTLKPHQLRKLGCNFDPYSSARLRQLLYHKLRFGAKDEYFLVAVKQSVEFYRANTPSSGAQSEQTIRLKLLDAASLRRLQGEAWNLLKRKDPIEESSWSRWSSESHSSLNHVLAAVSFLGDESLVRLYLAHHDLDLRMSYAFGGPLQCAASQGHLSIVKLLIGAHTKVENLIPNQYMMHTAQAMHTMHPPVCGPTTEAFYAAASGGHEVILRFLADILCLRRERSRGYNGFRTLFYRFAIVGGHDVILNELVQLFSPLMFDNEGRPDNRLLLNWRIFGQGFHGKDQVLKHLLSYGVAFGNERALRLVLAHNFDITEDCSFLYGTSTTALVCASRYGHDGIVKALQQEGAGRKAEDVANAVIMASRRGFTRVIQALLEHQLTDPNINRTLLLESSFRAAAEYGQTHVIEFLISQGLNMSSEDIQPAVTIAVDNGHTCVARLVQTLM
jgi:hypothetical protein